MRLETSGATECQMPICFIGYRNTFVTLGQDGHSSVQKDIILKEVVFQLLDLCIRFPLSLGNLIHLF